MSRALTASATGLVIAVLVLLGLTWRASHQSVRTPGVLIDRVNADSPVLGAVQAGDRVIAYDNMPISSPAALQATAENILDRHTIELRIQRGNRTFIHTVPPGRLGIDVRFNLSDDLMRFYAAGATALREDHTEEAVSSWTTAAVAAQRAGNGVASAWLQSKVGAVLEKREPRRACAAYRSAWTILANRGDRPTRATILSALGRCSSSTNDLEGAEAWVKLSLEANTAAGNEMWAAESLNALGVLARARGNLDAAEDYHNRARSIRQRLAPDSLALATSLDNLGLVAFDRGKLDVAEELHRAGLSIRERLAPDSLDVAMSHNNLGNIAFSRGDFAAARERHHRALAVRELKAPDSLDVAASLSNLGLVAWNVGDLGTAQDYHGRALAIRQRVAPGSLAVATSLNNLGEVARDRGDLARAQDFHSQSLAIRQKLAPVSVGVARSLNNLGQLARERGDFQAAQEYHGAAFAIRERLAPQSLDVAISLNNLGETARSRADLAKARESHERALALREQLAPDSLDVAESLSHLGDVSLDGGDGARATEYYRRALAIRQREAPGSLEVAASLGDLGDAARTRGDLPAAREYYRQALSIQERLAPDSLEVATTLVEIGTLASDTGRKTEALTHFKRSVEIVESQRRQITSTDARALFLAVHSTPYVGLFRTHLALNDLPSAFATVERARARSLVDLLAERRLDFRADAPVALLAEQEELDQKRSVAYSHLTKTSEQLSEGRSALNKLNPITDRDRIAALEKSSQVHESRMGELRHDLSNLAVRQRELDSRMRLASPRFAALKYPEPVDLRGAQATLDAGTVLLTYVVDERGSYLLAVTRTDVHQFALPVGRARLADQVRQFRAIVARERLGEPADLGRQLYDLLVRPAQAVVDRAERILICPDGPLQLLPFAALVSRRDPVRYFIDGRPIHLVSSMSVYAETRRHAPTTRAAGITSTDRATLLAFGDPVYSAAQIGPAAAPPVRAGGTAVTRSAGSLVPIPWTRAEVESIVRLFDGSARARLGADATEAAVKNEANQAEILHFALHGRVDEAMGLSSGLLLSQPDVLGKPSTPEDDGILQAWEIFERVRIRAELVVLSACQTGLGETVRGEGLIGLTRAFLYAGTRTVAVSLWDISDKGTADLMKTLYQELRSGASKDVALQRAMIAVRRDPSRAHPFYWAPFVLVGDWK